MRIAQVAPLAESVPPRLYGGSERVVSWITEELVRRGHEVTLFASGDSKTSAHLAATTARALRESGQLSDYFIHVMLQIEEVARRRNDFDLVHYHCDYLHFPFSRRCGLPQLTTLHGRLDLPFLQPIFTEFGEMPVVSISNYQRQPLPAANWIETIYHGLPRTSLTYSADPDGYLAFLGRICPEKRLDRAIRIAEGAGVPLKVAAKIDPADEVYFRAEIEPLLESPWVEYIGEIGDSEKSAFLGGACALLFPIDWPEPFGLVLIESLACGTPVIAWPHGSVREILSEGRTGFIVDSEAEAIARVEQLGVIDRAACRAEFESRFTVEAMVDAYENAYGRVISWNRQRMPPLRDDQEWQAAGA